MLPRVAHPLVPLLCLSVLGACGGSPVDRLSPTDRETFERIGTDDFPEADFVRVFRIVESFSRASEYERLTEFLLDPRVRAVTTQYQDYLDYLLAMGYLKSGQTPLALFLLRRLIDQGVEIVHRGQPLLQRILEILVEHTTDPFERLAYLKRLLAFQGQSGRNVLSSYLLGQTYQEIGFWDQAIESYRVTLSLPGASEVLDGKTLNRLRSLVAYRTVPRHRILRDLNELIQLVRRAQMEGNVGELARLQASSDFIIQYWAQRENYHPAPDQETFLRGLIQFSRNYNGENTVRWDEGLSELSNINEAYVRTTNWFAEWGTVYFYFRKIFFPPNPNIHGQWEWAGVYLGGK